MRPAASILLLTTLTGFAFGLLAWIGAYAVLGLLPTMPRLAITGVAVGLLLASLGLAASMLHLGRMERAWRALSQWRSSWLSREGVCALLIYPVAILFAITLRSGHDRVAVRLLGALVVITSLATVLCTAMIYASLRPIRQWHNSHTAPGYLIYAVFSGALLFALLHTALVGKPGATDLIAAAAAAIAWLAKCAYWRHVDTQTPLASLAAAIGSPEDVQVKPLDAPHFTENYVLREMGFALARRHAAKLRRMALVLAFALPLGLTLIASMEIAPLAATAAALACAAIGLLTERWLFFAEATHVAALYYGRRV
ncbi:MAG TPA: DmsC/YnfH family molybdoenzyme membrane anchor subunit [Steroidobacteraceae bacterium]|nr:DmsC/YnfH family molybdoenzyme membrane anchor subunit [Steroidobacteraceae bacterium]